MIRHITKISTLVNLTTKTTSKSLLHKNII